MPTAIRLRAVEPADLPAFFEHQLDPEATRMAAFPARQRDAFMAHWTKILADPACVARTIVYGDQIAGNIGAWTDAETRDRMVCYWIGREYWGRGIASAALAQFLDHERSRPLTARVVKHNRASLRVLQKCGFAAAGEDGITSPDGQSVEESILTFGSLTD